MIGDVVPLAVMLPGLDVAVYEVIVSPPSPPDENATFILPTPLVFFVAVPITGAFGIPAPNNPNPLIAPDPLPPNIGINYPPYANLVLPINAVNVALAVFTIVIA